MSSWQNKQNFNVSRFYILYNYTMSGFGGDIYLFVVKFAFLNCICKALEEINIRNVNSKYQRCNIYLEVIQLALKEKENFFNFENRSRKKKLWDLSNLKMCKGVKRNKWSPPPPPPQKKKKNMDLSSANEVKMS